MTDPCGSNSSADSEITLFDGRIVHNRINGFTICHEIFRTGFVRTPFLTPVFLPLKAVSKTYTRIRCPRLEPLPKKGYRILGKSPKKGISVGVKAKTRRNEL